MFTAFAIVFLTITNPNPSNTTNNLINKLDISIDTELRYRRYLAVKEALEATKIELERCYEANRMLPRAVSQREIDLLKVDIRLLSTAIIQTKRDWLESRGKIFPLKGTYIDVPIDPITFLRLQKIYPNDVFEGKRNGKTSFLVSPKIWKYYKMGILDRLLTIP